jgi:para-nitrobenzyl esterase
MPRPLPSLAGLALLAALACGDSPRDDLAPGPGGDAGAPDATSGDAGPSDAGPVDAGPTRCPVDVAPAPGVVVTEAGAVRGAPNGEAGWVYRGVPYAAPPIGERRWRAPEPHACYDGVFTADAFGAECPQYGEGDAVIGDEDCLGLNVWTPVGEPDGAARPVLVWIHGGGHEQGSGSRAIYDGSALARDEDVVVVTFNYRLGPFGFLSHPDLDAADLPSGNYGMRDQIAALEWVQANIARFGGDPERVLIFGQSAGGVSACRLVASPAAADLFHAAVLQSGACVAAPKARADATGVAFAADAGCAAGADTRACLGALSTEHLIRAFDRLGSGTNTVGSGSWTGVIDGDLLDAHPRDIIEAGEHNRVPVIVGSTREENGREAPLLRTEAEYRAAVRALYGAAGVPAAVIEAALEVYPVEDYASPRAAYVALTSDARFTCPARIDADLFAAGQDEAVYRYLFAHTADNGSPLLTAQGAWHGIDLFFVFGTLETASPLEAGPGDEAVIAATQFAWTSLARRGSLGDVSWPEWDGARLRLFDDGFADVEDPRAEQCDFWAPLLR